MINKNSIYIILSVFFIFATYLPVFAFGNPEDSPNLNTQMIYNFQNEYQGINQAVNNVKKDVNYFKVQFGQKVSAYKTTTERTIEKVNYAINTLNSEAFQNEINHQVEYAKEAMKIAKDDFNKFVTLGKQELKNNFSNLIEDKKQKIQKKLLPIKYTFEHVVNEIGSQAGQIIENILD